MKHKGILPLLAVLFAVILLGGTIMAGAFADPSDIYSREDALRAISQQYGGDPDASWVDDLDKVIPPEERERIMSADPSELTVTEQFAREFYAQFLHDKEVEGEISPMSEYELLAEFIQEEGGLLLSEEDRYTRDDMEVLDSYTRGDIREYGTSVGEIVIEHSPETREHELEMFIRLMRDHDRQALSDLKMMSEAYTTIAEEVSRVPVPESITEAHVQYVNSMKRSGIYVDGMTHHESDPLKTLMSVEEYLENAHSMREAKERVGEYFSNEHGIIYSEDEPGYAYALLGYIDFDKELDMLINNER